MQPTINIYAPNTRAPKYNAEYIKQVLADLKTETDSNKMMLGILILTITSKEYLEDKNQ
jgi:hypothetical protein